MGINQPNSLDPVATSRWFYISMLNVVLVALLGFLLRLAFVVELEIPYRQFLKAHAYLGLLGWLSQCTMFFLMRHFADTTKSLRTFHWLLGLHQLSVIALFLSMLIQGYGIAWVLSAIILTAVYWCFAILMWRHSRAEKKPVVRNFLRIALLGLLFSSTGLLLIAFFVLSNERWPLGYPMVQQFLIHMIFNLWLLFALLALLLKTGFAQQAKIPVRALYWTASLLILAALLTYSLATAWAFKEQLLYTVNSVGVVVQLAALIALFFAFRAAAQPLKQYFSKPWSRILLGLAAISFLLKVLLQVAAVVPAVAEVSHTIRNLMIGYLHLVALGLLSAALLGIAFQQNVIPSSRTTRWGLGIFTAGLLLTELLIFLQGTLIWAQQGFLPNYYEMIGLFTVLLPMGFIVLAFSPLIQKKKLET